MLTITGGSKIKTVRGLMSNIQNKQIPYALSRAMNDTGKVLLVVNRKEMRRNFNAPVPYTLNAFYMKPAKRTNLRMEILRKDAQGKKHYLEVQHEGGRRPQKRVEKLIKNRVAYPGIVGSVIPTSNGGGMTKTGGVNMAEVNRALAGLNASFSTTAYTRNKQRAAESKRAIAKKPSQYFVKSNEGGTKGGIYKRLASRKVKKVFHISDATPSYKPRFPFHPPLIKQTNLYLPKQFKRQFNAALRTMRF